MSKTKSKNKNNKKTKHNFYKIFSFILLLITVFSFSIIIYFDILPKKYLITGGLLLITFILIIIYKLNVRTCLFTKIICTLLSTILIFIEVLGSIYAFGTIDFFNNIIDTGLKAESYGIYVLQDSDFYKLKDLNNKNIAIKIEEETETTNKVLNKLNKRIKFEKKEYENIMDTINSVINKENDAFIINENLINAYLEEHQDLPNLRLIDNIEITIKDTSEFKSVNVTRKPFTLYISGIDTSGKVNKSARSDVNILAFINPNQGKILLVNTPRDYYVTLASKNSKDKLTHAGIYGTDESAKTLGLLYNTEINYYVRVNFTSFINIIDTLDGIEVNVQKPDYRYNGTIDCGNGYICEQNSKRKFDNQTIYIRSGLQKLNGEQALAYARNRHQYSGGDNDRGKHQTQIIEAMIKKAMSPGILTKYNSLLKSLSSGMITNIDQKTITKLVNYQLDKNVKWQIETVSAEGTGSMEPTYSLGRAKASVILPDDESVDDIKTKINNIMEIKNNS